MERRLRLPYFWDAMARSARGIVNAYTLGGQQGLWRQAERVLAPTLLVYGGRDQLVGFRMAQKAARAFRDSRLLTLPDAGHVAMMEYPETVALAFRELLAESGELGTQRARRGPAAPPWTRKRRPRARGLRRDVGRHSRRGRRRQGRHRGRDRSTERSEGPGQGPRPGQGQAPDPSRGGRTAPPGAGQGGCAAAGCRAPPYAGAAACRGSRGGPAPRSGTPPHGMPRRLPATDGFRTAHPRTASPRPVAGIPSSVNPEAAGAS